jgi:putative methanogen marker protein 4
MERLSPEAVFRAAKSRDRKVGVGSSIDSDHVRTSVDLANATGYGTSAIYHDAEELAQHLKEGRIDAAVRGDLDSKQAMMAIKKVFGLEKIERMALMQPRGGSIFFLAPVGVDEGVTVQDKVDMVRRGVLLLHRMGVAPSIGIMAGGRASDIGRCPTVDRTIHDAENIVTLLKGQGLEAENVHILIEEAVHSKNIIIAPDGISGNLIFRCLHLVDGGRSMGAPILNMDKVFVDTSRAKSSYVDSIALASALVGGAFSPKGHPGGHPGNIKR